MSDYSLTTPLGQGPVGPIGRVAGVSPSAATRETTAAAPAAERAGDTVELSEHARFMEKLLTKAPYRQDRVAQVRQAVIGGSYETDDKLNAAIDKLVEDLGL